MPRFVQQSENTSARKTDPPHPTADRPRESEESFSLPSDPWAEVGPSRQDGKLQVGHFGSEKPTREVPSLWLNPPLSPDWPPQVMPQSHKVLQRYTLWFSRGRSVRSPHELLARYHENPKEYQRSHPPPYPSHTREVYPRPVAEDPHQKNSAGESQPKVQTTDLPPPEPRLAPSAPHGSSYLVAAPPVYGT